MIELNVTTPDIVPFIGLDVGATFMGGDGKYYIKIPAVAKTKKFDVVGTYNAVCITSGDLAFVVGDQCVALVKIKAEVITL